MYEFLPDYESQTGQLTLSGSLTINELPGFLTVFKNSLEKVNHLSLNHKNIEAIDISYLQLLIAVYNSSVEMNKTFKINSNQPNAFYDLIKEAGIPAYSWISA